MIHEFETCLQLSPHCYHFPAQPTIQLIPTPTPRQCCLVENINPWTNVEQMFAWSPIQSAVQNQKQEIGCEPFTSVKSTLSAWQALNQIQAWTPAKLLMAIAMGNKDLMQNQIIKMQCLKAASPPTPNHLCLGLQGQLKLNGLQHF